MICVSWYWLPLLQLLSKTYANLCKTSCFAITTLFAALSAFPGKHKERQFSVC